MLCSLCRRSFRGNSGHHSRGAGGKLQTDERSLSSGNRGHHEQRTGQFRQRGTPLVFFFVCFAAVLFALPARWRCGEAWAYLILQWSASTWIAVWLKKHDPELLRERMKFMKASARRWDKVIVLVMTAVFVPLLLLPGLDLRCGWFAGFLFELQSWRSPACSRCSLWCSPSCGRTLTCPAWWRSRRRETPGRHHRTYAYVRHPLYLAAILQYLLLPSRSDPMLLGSPPSLRPCFRDPHVPSKTACCTMSWTATENTHNAFATGCAGSVVNQIQPTCGRERADRTTALFREQFAGLRQCPLQSSCVCSFL